MSTRNNLGFIIAVVAGVVGLLAFFFLPFFSVFGFISLTGQQIASLTSQNTNSQVLEQYQWLQLLWALPIAAVVVIALGLIPMLARQSRSAARGEAVGLILVSGLMILGLIVRYIIDSQPISSSLAIRVSLASFYGSGFWAYAVAMIAALVGGILALRTPLQQPLSVPPSHDWPQSQPWQAAEPWPPSEQVPPAETPPPVQE